MFSKKIEQLIEVLEKQELESAQVSGEIYAELFAAYLYKGDLANARFLWKRIPAANKTGNVELDQMWIVYTALWQNDLVSFFKNITYTWTVNVAELMFELKEKIYQETITLIGLAYSSIFEDRLGALIQQTPEAVTDTCKGLGWTMEDGTYPRLVLPKRAIQPDSEIDNAEAQLAKLTDFVSFLEN